MRFSRVVSAVLFVVCLSASAQTELKPGTSNQLPVRYANLVWWQPGELEPLVEARIPGFHGMLPATGRLTDQVEVVLVGLLHDKGIDAVVTAIPSSDVPNGPSTVIALEVTKPHIVLGEIHLSGGLPALKTELEEREQTLGGTDFDIAGSYTSIHDYLSQVFEDAGYLDIAIDTPTYSAPHMGQDKSAALLVVDATTVAHLGDLYRIGHFTMPQTPPGCSKDMVPNADLKVGNPASASSLLIARAEIAATCTSRGYLDATATVQSEKDGKAHTVAYTFSLRPGDVYHLASIDATSLTPAQRETFNHNNHAAPGAMFDKNLILSCAAALRGSNGSQNARITVKHDPASHTATIVLKP